MNQELQAALTNGSTVEHYKIIQTLGKGGFGITYLALDQHSNEPVVLKEFFPDSFASRTSQETSVSLLSQDKKNDFEHGMRRFEREADTLANFNHKNIVKVLTRFRANGTVYFSMRYIEGESLRTLQQRQYTPFTQAQIVSDVLPVLDGLQALHQAKLLHLDIKPDNILKTKYGEPLLIDFGGAKVDVSQQSRDVRSHSSMVATDGFAPPEQYATKAQQTAATDLYALGMTLYALMAPHS